MGSGRKSCARHSFPKKFQAPKQASSVGECLIRLLSLQKGQPTEVVQRTRDEQKYTLPVSIFFSMHQWQSILSHKGNLKNYKPESSINTISLEWIILNIGNPKQNSRLLVVEVVRFGNHLYPPSVLYIEDRKKHHQNTQLEQGKLGLVLGDVKSLMS